MRHKRKELRNKIALSRRSILLFALLFGTIGSYVVFHSFALTSPPANPIISQGLPVSTNGYNYSGGAQSAINDNDYGTQLCSPTQPVTASNPFYAAYNLSSVPTAKRGQVIWAMFSNTYAFDLSYFNDVAYSVPAAWTVDANASTGSTYPTSGWTTLATVTNNTWGTRQGIINLTGYNWVRINVTANLGSSGNNAACINSFDIHDASGGVNDDWMLFGDSITANTMDPSGNSTVAQLINQADPTYFPIIEPGGIPFLMASDGAASMATWLQGFPGKYVGLSYGTNDAAGNVSATAFKNNYITMIQAVLNAGKIPIIPTVPWRCSGDNYIQQYNQQIQNLYTTYPQIIHGPDLYGFFSTHQSYISGNDCIHPNSAGEDQYRLLWANAMLANFYNVTPSDTTPPSVPANLHATGTSSSTISLGWTASTDNSGGSGVAGYKLYRGGTLVATVTGPSTVTYTDTGLSSNTSYSYTISAYDVAGNESARSAAVNVTTAAGSAIPGDCNGDGHVNVFDLSMLLTHYGQTYAACDFNADGVVSILDLSTLLTHYGT